MRKQFTMEDIPVLYEDNHIIVVLKPQNMPVQADESGDADLLTVLKEYIKQKYNKPGNAFLGLVHRLDRTTGGVMVFARNSKCAARLSEAFANREVEKEYLAVLCGTPKAKQGTLVNYLKKNILNNTVYVATEATEGAKRAELSYEILATTPLTSLAKIQLGTGRSHQIRVQFSAINTPVFGDARYGGDKYGKHNLALWAFKLVFTHPVTKDKMVFVVYPPENVPWTDYDTNALIKFYDKQKTNIWRNLSEMIDN